MQKIKMDVWEDIYWRVGYKEYKGRKLKTVGRDNGGSPNHKPKTSQKEKPAARPLSE